ncbi:FecR family protein [Pseudoflavitalea sp. X16]|uniref:FecR family protein n=1 Tax=Paraflavitalea devenefica TaxID=2716334 RepID=UPI00141F9FB7|nr:FecR domain-containing protein [Paraflavitalea devenefica]NII29771.1 FecR family protein [Paraflavitalea devenefica]
MLNEAHLQALLEKALAGQASDEELRTLVEALQHDENLAVTEEITALLSKRSADHILPGEERTTKLADEILKADKLPAAQPLPARRKAAVVALWKKIAAAAIIVGIAVTAFYLWQINRRPADAVTGNTEKKQDDVNPGNNKARLILADGSIVVLDTIANGTLSVQGHTRIAKQKDGQLSYSSIETAPANNAAGPLFNTVAVPRGGQYQLILADGTEVWLNAASSLRFPVSFTGNERIVELEGEGYFEVAKDAARPFAVRTKRADVQVLGTHFNVCAYPEEDWKTTLLEGKVKVVSGEWSVVSGKPAMDPANRREFRQQAEAILEPGQQAIISSLSSPSNQSSSILVQTADIDEAIAWKEGYFQFNDASITAIMHQVSRWYDVDIVYKEAATRARFNGRINRAIRLSGVVNALKEGGINCTIEQNRLLVYP